MRKRGRETTLLQWNEVENELQMNVTIPILHYLRDWEEHNREKVNVLGIQ